MSAPSSVSAGLSRKINIAKCKETGITVCFCLLVAFLQLQILYPLHKTTDLPTWDEALYMGQGAAFLHGGNLGALSGSPLYALFYSFLVAAVGRVGSIFLAQYLIKTFVSVALFCFLSANLRSRLLASLLAMVWIVASVNVYPGVLVNQAAFALFLLALIFFRKRPLLALMLLCLCTLARLDYLFVLVAFTVYLVWKIVKAKTGKQPSTDVGAFVKSNRRSEYVLASILAIFVVYILVHVSDFNPGGKRGWIAFNQNYAVAQVANGRFHLNDPYFDSNIVMQADFPGANSLRQALVVNPRRFVRYVVGNIPRLAETALFSVVVPYPKAMFWTSVSPDRSAQILRIMYGVLAGSFLTILLLASFQKEFSACLRRALRERNWLFYAMIIGLFDLIPFPLSSPNPRYTLILIPFLLFWPGLVFEEALQTISPQRFRPRMLIALNLLFVLAIELAPKPFIAAAPPRPTYLEISELTQVWPNQRLKFLGVGSTWYAAYLGEDKVTPIEPFGSLFGLPMQNNAGDLGALISQYDPDVVLLNPDFVGSPNFQKPTLSALDSSHWSRCAIGSDTFYFKMGKVDSRFPCFAN
jgi:hypothetical protein